MSDETEKVVDVKEKATQPAVSTKLQINIPIKRVLIPASVAVLVALAAVPGYYYYNEYQHAQMLLNDPAKAAKIELDQTIASVGKLLELPPKERPTLATVSDVSKLASQPFFRYAKNGDKVLIFTEAKKAILYRPGNNKIVEVAPLNVTDSAQAVAGAATDSAQMQLASSSATVRAPVTPSVAPLRLAIYNGTPKTGLAGTIEQIIKVKIPNAQVVEKGNAQKNDYDISYVIDVKGNARSAAEQIASIIGGQVMPLPVGETLPDADFLIIAGQK